MGDRESVRCGFCGAEVGEPCEFVDGPAPMVEDNGVMRRVVHAARYAETLPPGDRGAFWSTAVEKYLATKLAAITAKERRNPHCSNCGDGRGGPFGHEISECTFRREGSDHA